MNGAFAEANAPFLFFKLQFIVQMSRVGEGVPLTP
jgi:hypothetical protein